MNMDRISLFIRERGTQFLFNKIVASTKGIPQRRRQSFYDVSLIEKLIGESRVP